MTVEDRLNHKYIELDPIACRLCRVRWNKASIITYKEQLSALLGKKEML